MQPRVQYAILFGLISLFTGCSTSNLTINVEKYNGADPILVGQDVIFKGTIQYFTFPYGVVCKLEIAGSSSRAIEICDLDVTDCNGYVDITCNCVSQVGDTYNFVISDTARLERSKALLYCARGDFSSNSQIYPEIIVPTTKPSTVTRVPTTKPPSVTRVPTTKPPTVTRVPTTKLPTVAAALKDKTNGSDGRGINENYTIVVGILSVRVLALLK